jgi:hypothetical protein
VHILETYCEACRRPWDDVADEPCIAATDSEHLRGGPIGERKNRTHTHDCQLWGCTGTGIPQSTLSEDRRRALTVLRWFHVARPFRSRADPTGQLW